MKTTKQKLEEAFRLLREVVDETGVNVIDNYGYREYTSLDVLKQYLPSLKKAIGRTGDDALAPDQNYFHVELKSGTKQSKTLTVKNFPRLGFDKQNDPARREYIYNYDGFSLSFFEFYHPYPTAIVFVPSDQVQKLHPVFRAKQQARVEHFQRQTAAGKNIGRDTIDLSLEEIVEHVGKENLVCWLRDQRMDSVEFFHLLETKQVKINS